MALRRIYRELGAKAPASAKDHHRDSNVSTSSSSSRVKYLYSMSHQALPPPPGHARVSLLTHVAHVERVQLGTFGPVPRSHQELESQQRQLAAARELRMATRNAHDVSCLYPKRDDLAAAALADVEHARVRFALARLSNGSASLAAARCLQAARA